MKATHGTAEATKLLWSMREAAESLAVSRSTLRRLVRQGELPVVTFCDRPLFRPADIEALIERRLERTTHAAPTNAMKDTTTPRGGSHA